MNRDNQKNLNHTTTVEFNNNKFDVEIYFIDLDGTLLDRRITKKVSKKNIETVRAKNKICPVVISTGRSYGKKVSDLMKLLNIKYAVCQNGSIIVNDKGDILLNIQLNDDQIQKVIKVVQKHKLSFTINSKFVIYSASKIRWLYKLFLWNKIQKIQKSQSKLNEVNKLVVVGTLKRKKVAKVAKELQEVVPNASIKISGDDYVIEITDKTATKGTGDAFVANLLKIDPKKSIHIGDSQNDTTTINVVGALIAMKNSSQKLLNVATHIGPANKNAGLAKVLNGEFQEIKRD